MTKERTAKEEAEFKRLDRKVMNGKATRREVLRAMDLKRKPEPKTAPASQPGRS